MRSRLMLAPLAALLACGGSDSTSPGPGGGGGGGTTTPVVTTAVSMQSSSFTPKAIRVAPSATVVWTNNDNFNHDVSFANTTIGNIAPFATGSQSLAMPAAPGTYSYVCTIHPGMSGTVQVQ